MIYDFRITTASGTSFPEMISQRFKWIREQGYAITVVSQHQSGDMEAYEIHLQGSHDNQVFRNEDIVYIFKHQMSELIAEHILLEWESPLINKEIRKSCRGLSGEEQRIVFYKAAKFLRRCNDNESLNLLMNYGRKNKIAHRILDYIHEHQLLVLEGFINFCLQDYLTEIRFAVELAMEELKNEKEYNDFVTLLRYFVDTQVPKINEVNIMMDENGVFNMWDGSGIKIEENYMSYYLDDMLLNEINFDDVLISILITISPRRIILHNAAELGSEPVETIKKVFKDRIRMCTGCERCLKHLNKNTRP
ncbi:MAG TPA: putative sporulation protein YtxC [Syntrophomonadaceae bacterium]|nr:putative sporulation protein YtxC [Syntrophomonadaceae bacterium]HQE24367.1 putative sporulation protein YtxC [Syntrophomonadaceae bacterium]